MFLGILIFWGIAATSYRGAHITVDLLWELSNRRWRRVIDVFATLMLLFIVTVQTLMLFDKVTATRAQHVLTYDMHLPTWPFFLVAWLGDAAAVILIAAANRAAGVRARTRSTRTHTHRRACNEPRRRYGGTSWGSSSLFAMMLLRVPGRHGDGAGRRRRVRRHDGDGSPR